MSLSLGEDYFRISLDFSSVLRTLLPRINALCVSRWASRKGNVVTRTGKGKPFHARLGGSCPGGSSRSFRVSLASHPSPVSACLSAAGGRNFATPCRSVPSGTRFSSPAASFSSIHDPSRESEISFEEMRAKLARRDALQDTKSASIANTAAIASLSLFDAEHWLGYIMCRSNGAFSSPDTREWVVLNKGPMCARLDICSYSTTSRNISGSSWNTRARRSDEI